MPNRTRCASASLVAVCAGLCLAVTTPRADGAGPNSAPAGVPPALELYALEAELVAARDRATALGAARRAVAAEQSVARVRLGLAEAALATAQRRLARLVRGIYTAGEPDPLAVVFGAQSLDEAEEGLDALRRAGAQAHAVGSQARTAALAVRRLAGRLMARERLLRGLEADARRRSNALAAVVERRRTYIADLRRRAGAAAAAAARRQAESAQRHSGALTEEAKSAAPALVQETAPVDDAFLAVRGIRRLTVDAVAYSLSGRTASGLPVSRGVAAVDPTVIPLGARMHVPGYGTAVAADIGSAVRGLVIDLWFPTLAEARAWGRRTVTITLS